MFTIKKGQMMKLLLKKFLFICVTIFPLYIQAAEAQFLIEHVKRSIKNAEVGKSNLTKEVLHLSGLSSSKVRHLLNNLCTLPNSYYLEIGVYQGSTFISALYNNTNTLIDAIAIDNWSEFGFQKDVFLNNCIHYLDKNSFRFYESDSFSVNLNDIFNQPVTIYFYDGNHSVEAQRKAFTYFDAIFADIFIAVVDDWNWEQVKVPTKKAFVELGYTVLFERELPARYVGDLENWWNGIYIAVIQKPSRKNIKK